jgi:hypothetical protein
MKKSHNELKATINKLVKSQKSMSSLMEEMFAFMKRGSSMNVGAFDLEVRHIADDPPLAKVAASLGVQVNCVRLILQTYFSSSFNSFH